MPFQSIELSQGQDVTSETELGSSRSHGPKSNTQRHRHRNKGLVGAKDRQSEHCRIAPGNPLVPLFLEKKTQ